MNIGLQKSGSKNTLLSPRPHHYVDKPALIFTLSENDLYQYLVAIGRKW